MDTQNQQKKILVVEDDKYLWNAYHERLVNAGFSVKLASDGEEALTAIATYQPDVILLDIIIPKKDGITLLAEINNNSTWQKIPVIVTSNLSQDDKIQRCLQLGAVEYVIKSDISLNELVTKLQTVTFQGN